MMKVSRWVAVMTLVAGIAGAGCAVAPADELGSHSEALRTDSMGDRDVVAVGPAYSQLRGATVSIPFSTRLYRDAALDGKILGVLVRAPNSSGLVGIAPIPSPGPASIAPIPSPGPVGIAPLPSPMPIPPSLISFEPGPVPSLQFGISRVVANVTTSNYDAAAVMPAIPGATYQVVAVGVLR